MGARQGTKQRSCGPRRTRGAMNRKRRASRSKLGRWEKICREYLYGGVRAPASPVGATHLAAATQRKARMIWRTERRLISISAWATQRGIRCTSRMFAPLPEHVLAQIRAPVRLAPAIRAGAERCERNRSKRRKDLSLSTEPSKVSDMRTG
jgi:hypothetical protein